MSAFPATRRQQDLLRFIVGYQRAHDGVSPSYQEMCDALGIASKQNVIRLLNGLGERGYVHRLPARARAIQILAPVAVPTAPDGAPLYAVALPEMAL